MTDQSRGSTIPATLVTAASAGVLGFLIPAAFFKWLGPFEGWAVVSLFVAVPAVAVALMPYGVRIYCFVLGLLAVLSTTWMAFGGPDNPLLILPLAAISLTSAAVIAEACVRAARRLLRPRTADTGT